MAVPTTRLLVLAVVRLLQPVHGYDVRRELLSWRADDWAHTKPGSIYGALKTLERDGLIAVEGVDQGAGRPERTSYHLTSDGEKEFGDLMRAVLFSAEQPKYIYYTAVALFPHVPRSDVIAALRSRILKFEAELVILDREVERVLAGSGDPTEAEPYQVADAMGLAAAHVRADLEWARKTLQRIESGQLDVWTPGKKGALPARLVKPE
ncbi:PadR family transcriptional regulator [Nocardia uniformis]|uniref:PadR family transcriptional regulator n=1 Tax=Nocardia uniformis TaxID=53432 RepID=A0A849C4I4_9NOCA|nr:PadR family transcriptional regulator [Nocardia uniformis]NNH72526.1 PadR family transcriptional regulator [Nocardia uniformis]